MHLAACQAKKRRSLSTTMAKSLLVLCCLISGPNLIGAQEAVSYAKHVRPFLAKYCLDCHNAKALKAGLNLETFKALLEGSDRGPVLVAGKPDESSLINSIEGKSKAAMPPKT